MLLCSPGRSISCALPFDQRKAARPHFRTVFLIALISFVPNSPAQVPPPALTTLYSFSYPPASCCNPYTPVAISAHGALFGTTQSGGPGEWGSVFELTPPAAAGGTWTESVLYTFTGQNGDGSEPNYSGVVIGPNGELYGTTTYGGSGSCTYQIAPPGRGIVYELVPPVTPGGAWTETVLHSFANAPDGANPYAGLLLGANGVLYGTTAAGWSFLSPAVLLSRRRQRLGLWDSFPIDASHNAGRRLDPEHPVHLHGAERRWKATSRGAGLERRWNAVRHHCLRRHCR